VFYHTSARKAKDYGLRYLVVGEDANEKMMDELEKHFKLHLEYLLMKNLVEKIQHEEELMKTHIENVSFTLLITANLSLGQYTTYNFHSEADADADAGDSVVSMRMLARLYN
jgi:adenine C2-methylase RlmN of 23S rRNA A2503 and tRNA A37